ncbi:MAG TPA: glycosyltransferase family 4 protein [Terriglobales bacterium]|nr:glycosyltransferase family 4 protein [Terriglobales bacterium]
MTEKAETGGQSRQAAKDDPVAVWVIDSLKLGGAERLAMAMALAPPPGWRVELIALQPPGNGVTLEEIWGERTLELLGARLHQLHMRSLTDWREYRTFMNRLRALRPRLVHSHLDYATLWSERAARQLGVPHVSTRHTMATAAMAGVRARVVEALVARARRRVTLDVFVSAAQRRATIEAEAARPAAATPVVIANGVEAAPGWSASERQRWRRGRGWQTQDIVLLTVAVARDAKGWRDWLLAAEIIVAARPTARLVWVGGGPDFARFRAAAEASPAWPRLFLAGARPDVADWLRAADLFLFPSHGEALPTAVIEAMAQQLPVIATDLEATREVLGDCGAYVPAGDGRALAQAALSWMDGLEVSATACHGARRGCERWLQSYAPAEWRARLASAYRSTIPANRTSILMVEFFSRGGLFHYSHQLAVGLSRKGAHVRLLTGHRLEVAAKPARGLEILPWLWTWNPHYRPRLIPKRALRAVRAVRYIAAWEQVARAVKRLRPEVVMLGDFEHRCDAWYVRRLARLRARQGFRLADIWHNVEAFDRSRAGRVLAHQSWRAPLAQAFDHIFVHAHALAENFERRTGVRPAVIAHGNQDWIAVQAGPDPGLDRRFALPPQRPLALLFGTLTAYKGVDVLIEALAQVPAAKRPLALIAGMPSANVKPAAWRARARRLELDPWLRWDERYVPTPETAWYFRRADFIVLPYRAASQSGVAHLALTFGKPLIVTATGGLPELIDGNGLVVEPGDAAGLAEAMERLATDVRLRRKLGRRSIEIAAERHDWDVIAGCVLSEFGAESRPSADESPASSLAA